MRGIDMDQVGALVSTPNEKVLSLYLPVDPTDEDNRRSPGKEAWRIFLKNALRETEASLDGDKEAKALWAGTVARLESFLSNYRISTATLALFVAPEGTRHVELPVRLEPRAGYGRPLIQQLLWAMDEYQHYLAVLIGADRMRAVSSYLGFVGEVATLKLDTRWGMEDPDRWLRNFKVESRSEEHQRNYQKSVADQVNRMMIENPDVERLILGGSEREAHGVRNYLHPHVAGQVVAILPIPVDSTDSEVVGRIEDVAIAYERDGEREIVERVVGAARAGGPGVTGLDEVWTALEEHRVRLLVVASPVEDEELGERLMRRAFDSSATVEFVHGEAAELLREYGSIAAALYYG